MPGDTNFNNAIELEKTETKAFKKVLKTLEKLDLEELNLNEPGNMNYFIRLKEKKEEEMVLWSNMDSAPTELVTFYKNTIKGLKTEAIQ